MDFYRMKKETHEILKRKYYRYGSQKVDLCMSSGVYDFYETYIYTPKLIQNIMNDSDHYMADKFYEPFTHDIHVAGVSSFVIAKDYYRPLILLPSKSIIPEPNWEMEGDSLKKRLNLCSSLSFSLASPEVSQMFYEQEQGKREELSESMILSGSVAVFRNGLYELIEHPYPVSVLTMPILSYVPVSSERYEFYRDKMRNALMIAARNRYRTVIIPMTEFKTEQDNGHRLIKMFGDLLFDEGYVDFFEQIIFCVKEDMDRDMIEKMNGSFHSMNTCLLCHDSTEISQNNVLRAEALPEKTYPYIMAAYPMPQCNYCMKNQYNTRYYGYTQGILEEGIPFVAELYCGVSHNDIMVVFVFPYFSPSQYLDAEEFNPIKIRLPHINPSAAFRLSLSVLCRDMVATEEKLEESEINYFIRYLIQRNLIEIKKSEVEGFAHLLYDKTGSKVVAVEITLMRYDQVEALVPLKFQDFILKNKDMK